MTPADETSSPGAGAFRPGTIRGVDGFFRAGQDAAGRWWLVDPAGAAFFVRAVHGVRTAAGLPTATAPVDSAVRLRRWGFNAVGAGGDGAGRDDGLAFLATVDFSRSGAQIVAPGARLPDVFAPDWPRVAAESALTVCAPLAQARQLLGWITDDAPGWAQPARTNRPTLLQICLSLEPGYGAYHAAWEFVLALHGGRLDAVAKAWGVALANKEVVRELTRAETGITTRGYRRDEARWTREFARRYFTTTAAAIRAADPNHLVFGCRFQPAHLRQAYGGQAHASSSVRAECVHPAVDVALRDWNDLPAPGSLSGPVLASNVGWADEAFWRPNSPVRPGAGGPAASVVNLTSVERMLRRGRAALARTARHPAVVGYVWGQWQDEPGEQPPFARGLVHVNGAEAREHTELLTQFNARAESLHRAAAIPTSP